MEACRCLRLGAIVLVLQTLSYAVSEHTSCTPGFDSELYVFKVDRVNLHIGRRLGKVVFNDCTGRTQTLFNSVDTRFKVDMDGTVKLKRQVTLHDGHKRFSVHAWDSQGRKHTVALRVELDQPRHNQHQHLHHPHQVDLLQLTQPNVTEAVPTVPVLLFPKSFGGLRRRKRDWIIPDIKMPENTRGPFPELLVQIKTSHSKELKIVYSITGAGADQPPLNLFTIDAETGTLYITQPLDREKQAHYLLLAHAVAVGGTQAEDPMELKVIVIDQNDNKPIFTQNPFLGSVAEASKIGTGFMKVVATDADEPKNANSDVRYKILSQDPLVPNNAFSINPVTGDILVNSAGLDKEKISKYTLEIQAADLVGEGLTAFCKAEITVTDSNDLAPQFEQLLYTVSVPENKVGQVVVLMPVTDGDDPNTPAWATKFKIISGDSAGMFSITTGPNKQEGIITTAKPLDFEAISKYTLVVAVENEVDFAMPLPTSTAQVVVNVVDVNEAPFFSPAEKRISKPENVPKDTNLVLYSASDPDTAMNQKLTYKVGSDPAGWLSVVKETGMIKVKSEMDRESTFVKDGQYKALILAMDDDIIPATGTGTLIIQLEDVNDNAPAIVERVVEFCNDETVPVLLTVIDKDDVVNGAPYRVELKGESASNWTARMNDTKTGIILTTKTKLKEATYSVRLMVSDNHGLNQISTVEATVCNCKGANIECLTKGTLSEAGIPLPIILGILGSILALLLLVLLLLMFMRRKSNVKKDPLLPEDDLRDNIYYYDEEGGGEDDQDYDLSVLHRGLDNRPEIFRNDVIPTFMPAPQYRPRPANPEDIGNFIDDNLKAADNDPTAPPYDSLLVFDYEGAGSEAGSLSSLNSSSSGGDQDYDCLNEWGPRFKKLADMYGGGEDE
ncbi:B-cadherin-like [Clupea harengus]|uniref:Cadherin-1 n=1 Tax=Clupea harengus TaxID=7950 RepID=A0A6P8FPU2_CLUHA|nr:B-cadherin-like [Clupea harengus]